MRFAAVTLLTIGLSATAHTETLYGFAGRCHSFTIADRAVSGQCQDIAYSARFQDGHVGLIFLTGNDGTHVAFTWQEKPGQDDLSGSKSFTAAVDVVALVVLSEVEQIPAKGTCEIAKAYNLDTTFKCEATTDKGRFAVEFSADGRMQPKKLFGAPEPVKP